MSSNRLISEQFGAGITLDASRMEHAIEDLLARMNAVDPSLVYRRWVETNLVAGFLPTTNSPPSHQIPWMRAYNPNWLSIVEIPAAGDIKNKWRSKAAWIDGVDTENMGNGELWTYELSLYITKPTILSSLAMTMAVDSDYVNDFVYGADPPPGENAGFPLQDLTMNITVDSALDADDRKKTSVEAVNYRVVVTRSKISNLGIGFPDNLNPLHPTGAVNGLLVELPVGCIFPENSRVRIQIIIPEYGTLPFTASSWGTYGYSKQVLSAQLSLLEACEV